MFGASTQAGSSAPASGGLFGNSKPPGSGGLFGSASASPGGLFGSSTTSIPQAQTGGSLFGSSTTASSTPQTGLFGASNQPNPAQNASGSLFGASNQSNPTQNTSNSLFGNSAQTSSGSLFGASNPSGNLFGASNQPATTQNTPGGLFGASNQPASTQNTPGGLFGASNQPASTQNTPGGLFGASNQPASTQNTSSNLFGASTQSTPGNLFGSSNQPAASQNLSGNLFGASTPSAASPFGSANANFGASGAGNLFGNSQTNALNASNSFGNKASGVPTNPGPSNAVSQSNPMFTRTTRFNDLPDEAKKQIEMLDAMIQTQCRHSDALKAMQLGTEITAGTSLLRQVTSEMHATSASVTTSSNLLDSIRQAIDTDVTDLLKLAAIVDAHHAQRIAVGNHNPAESAANPLKFQYEFFLQKTNEMEDRIKKYRQRIDFAELQLKGLFDRPSPASIVPALKAQHSSFMVLADKVAQLNTAIVTLKEDYREIWRHQTGSVRDPFAEVDQAFGLNALEANFPAP